MTADIPDTETKQPPFDSKAFRQALGCFPTGVAIVTTTDPTGAPVGITCNSFSSVSLDPPLVLWSLRTASKSLPVYSNADGFAINVLADHQCDLSNRFASSTIRDKFENVPFSNGTSGHPLIHSCVATFECKTVAQHIEGDHIIFIGQVAEFVHGQQFDPLVFCKGAYANLTQSLRDLVDFADTPAEHLYQARSALHDIVVRLACENGTDQDFDAIDENLRSLDDSRMTNDVNKRNEKALDFFNLIAKAAHNDVLQTLNNSLTQIMWQALSKKTTAKFRPELMAIRYQILEHVKQRQADQAAEAVRVYLEQIRVLDNGTELAA